jgi:hypothetical protein
VLRRSSCRCGRGAGLRDEPLHDFAGHAIGRLHSHALQDGPEVAGEIRWTRVVGQLALTPGAIEPLPQGGDAGHLLLRQLDARRLGVGAARRPLKAAG